MSSNPPPRLYPVLSLVVGACLWGVIWYPMRRLEALGLSGIWLALIIYATALVASLPRTYTAFAEFRRYPGALALLMVAAGWTNVAFVEAVLEGNILRVLLLFYLAPLWATLMGRLVLRERISRLALLSLGLAMGGALAMLWDPRLGAFLPRGRADWLALSSGFAFALSNVIVRKMQQVSLAAKVCAVWSGVVVVAAAMIALFAPPVPSLTGAALSGAVALGLFGIMAMTVLVQYGVTHMPVHRSAVIALVEIVAGAASQQLLTDEIVTAREWAGGALIIVGAYLAARASAR